MTLIKTSLLNGVAVIIKILALLGINKILAMYVGPAGYAVVGQFQNLVQMINALASGGINTGVTKYTAEYNNDENKQKGVWSTAAKIILLSSIAISLLVFIFNNELSLWLLKSDRYGRVFIWFSVTLIFFVFNAFFLSILNGKKEISRYVLANIIGSIFSLIFTIILVIQWGLYGALVAFAIYQSLSFFTTIFLCYKLEWFKLSNFSLQFDRDIATNLAKYTLMALTSAICIPISHILIRNYIGINLGWELAGYWEAMWRLSSTYLLFITLTLSVYYLPRLSELNDSLEIKKEVYFGYKVIIPIIILGTLFIYLLKDFIITMVFTKEFLPMRDLFFWQLIGDVFKICSWILGYIVLAKAYFKFVVLTEIFFSSLFVFLGIFLTDFFGFIGVSIAHIVNYIIHFLVLFVFLKNRGIL